MFDLIEVFRRTFATYYREKRIAKQQINHLKECLKFWNDVNIKLKSVKNIIKINNEVVPKREGFGYTEFCEFENFLLLGYKYSDGTRIGRGYIEEIDNRHIDILRDYIFWSKQYYKERKYDQVEYFCKRYYDKCRDFDETYKTNTQELAQYPKLANDE